MLSFLRVDLRQQKYLVLLFCFTVLLPALLLILFGFRLMEADSYRVERLFRNEQESALQQLARSSRRDSIESGSVSVPS